MADQAAELFESARRNDVGQLALLLDERPDDLHAREHPYGWTLLHAAAHHGSLDAVRLLLDRGIDVNAREQGDSTYAMHWAAAAGHADIVRTLADAGGDMIGAGDDHELEVIGWATCWDGCDDDAHREVVDLLTSRGARHHIFSAIAMNLADEVRRIVAANPSALNRRMSRNENNQSPLQFAVRMNRPQMVSLLVELGADPLAVDGGGQPVASYAKTTDVDRPVMEAIHRMMLAEVTSADRGDRTSRASPIDLLAAISLEDWQTATRLVGDNPDLLQGGGALHLLAKRGDARGVKWLLDNGADPDALWAHWDAEVTPLHMAAFSGNAAIAQLLLDAGADKTIRDSRHDSDALGWAEFFGQLDVRKVLAA